jgi:hypothetical protein
MTLTALTLASSSLACLSGSPDGAGTNAATTDSTEAVASVTAVQADGRHRAPQVTPPPAILTARWWQWIISTPQSDNPNFDTTGADCAVGQQGPVWFLAGTFGGPATRACTVPAGKSFLIPVLNVLDGAVAFDCEPTVPGVACNVNTLRGLAAAQNDAPTLLSAQIDGVDVANVAGYRVKSPVFPTDVSATDGIFGLPGGFYNPQVSDGYWLLIDDLAPGAHTVHIHGIASPSAPFGQTDVDVTYQLTISQ